MVGEQGAAGVYCEDGGAVRSKMNGAQVCNELSHGSSVTTVLKGTGGWRRRMRRPCTKTIGKQNTIFATAPKP